MRRTLLALALLLCALPAAQRAHAEPLPDLIQQRYESLKSFRAAFTQTLTNAASGEQEIRTGTILFKQPGLVRWVTTEPENELLVVGPNAVWDYFADEELAIKYRVTQVFNSKTMIRFLSGQANLREDFQVENQGDDAGLTKLKLVPYEPEPGLVLAYIWAEPEGLVKQVLVVDFFGNGNQVALSDMDLDVAADDEQFVFTPPPGVDVEDNTLQ